MVWHLYERDIPLSRVPEMKTSPFHFQSRKAAQAIASLLRSEPGRRMNYYRLLKLLYIADRESVRASGRPIVGGRLIAMDRGPLHSAGFDVVQGKAHDIAWWSQFFRTDRFDIEMTADPGNGDLSAKEIDMLNRVWAEFEGQDDWEVGKHTHAFEEFQKNLAPPGKSATIPFADLLAAVDRSGDLAAIEQDAEHKALFDKVFGI